MRSWRTLGEPTWWATSDNGYSRLGYDFHLSDGTVNTPYISPASFVFDAKGVLVDADYAGSYKTIHVERGPTTFAYAEALVGPQFLILDGIIPADWDKPNTVPIGGYIRTPIHIEHVLAGNIAHRDMVVEFTTAALRKGPWTAFMLLATDKFGTIRVADWAIQPSLCELSDADARKQEIATIVRDVKASSTCTTKQESMRSRERDLD